MESLEEEDNEDDGEKVFLQFRHIQLPPEGGPRWRLPSIK